MRTEMTKVFSCDAEKCSYYEDALCRAQAINIGGSGPVCNAFVEMDVKCIGEKSESGVGACKINDCVYNDCLICSAPSVNVGVENGSAVCGTYSIR